jgi:hypothetical protein
VCALDTHTCTRMRAAKAQRQQPQKGHILTWGLKLVLWPTMMSREEKCSAVKRSWLISEKESGRCKIVSKFMTMREKIIGFPNVGPGSLWPCTFQRCLRMRKKIYTIKAFLGRDCENYCSFFYFILTLLKFGYDACVFFVIPGLFPISKWTLLVTSTLAVAVPCAEKWLHAV